MAAPAHRLFFALQPPGSMLAELERCVAELKATQQIRGRWLKAEKLHVTLQFLGDFAAADEIVHKAEVAGDRLRAGRFEFALDRVETFVRRFNPPCVLRCDAESDARLRVLAHDLGNELTTAGLGEHLETRPYVPHLTIAYAERALPAPIPIPPLVWRAEDFCLLDSRGGAHEELARWPLRT